MTSGVSHCFVIIYLSVALSYTALLSSLTQMTVCAKAAQTSQLADRLAQWIARQTSNLKVAGSSPALVRPIFWLFHGRP